MPPAATMSIVNSVNLALGLAGLAAAPGLLRMARWGFWGTVVLSLLTILFDGVSSVVVSSTALGGLVLPLLFLALLLTRRVTFLRGGKSP
jgi:hypothetical protein